MTPEEREIADLRATLRLTTEAWHRSQQREHELRIQVQRLKDRILHLTNGQLAFGSTL